MSTILPPFIAIKSSLFNSYLNYAESEFSANIQFNGENVFSPLAKFEVVKGNSGIGLVHIRCSHNKKFLRQISMGSFDISAEADEPIENRSSWMCTLFEPQLVDGNTNRVRLALVRSTQALYTIAERLSNRNLLRTWTNVPSTNTREMFEAIDLESLVIVMEAPRSGPILINFSIWRCNRADSAILADTPTPVVSVTPINQTTSFWPIKIDRNVVALRSFVSNAFCGRFGNDDMLFATHQTISANSRLVMEELVLSRIIYNVDFDLANAVIYGETPVNMATANVSNNTSAENTVEFKFAYTESRSTTWTANHSWMVGVSVSVSFRIPFIGSTGIDISTEYSGSYEWGETLTSENTLETTYTVVVPPHTSITVSLMATKGSCDVPFSYYQKDVLYNGQTEIYRKEDGLYTGINSYNFRYEVAETGTEETSRTDQRIIYMEQKIPMPSEAAITQLLPSSENKATQEQNLEGIPVPLPLEEMPQEQLPLEETSQEQKVPLPLEETVDEVVPVT